jgi:hypothetical protein
MPLPYGMPTITLRLKPEVSSLKLFEHCALSVEN